MRVPSLFAASPGYPRRSMTFPGVGESMFPGLTCKDKREDMIVEWRVGFKMQGIQ